MFLTTGILARIAGARLVFLEPRTLWVRSLAGSFSLVCNFYAMTKLPTADAITLSNAHPLWIVLATAFLLHQVPTLAEWLGVALGLVGVVLIQQPHLGGNGLAAIVALISSLSTAVSMLGLHRLRHIDARAVVCHFAGVASVFAFVWVLFRPAALSRDLLTPLTLLLLLAVGISGTLGQVCITRAYAAGRPASMAIVGLTQVGFAMVLDMVLWHRSLTLVTGLGFLFLLLPSAWLSINAAHAVVALQRASDQRLEVSAAAAHTLTEEMEVAQSMATPNR
jgi:drug/metabolite transporter (DMT)-like permease